MNLLAIETSSPILTVAVQRTKAKTSERSIHGHPSLLSCPVGVTRKSLALYFYLPNPQTISIPAVKHNTLWVDRAQHRLTAYPSVLVQRIWGEVH